MKVTFPILALLLLFGTTSAIFFPKIFSNKPVKDSQGLTLDTFNVTRDFLDRNRLLVVGCSILLRYVYSLHHQTIATGLAYGISLNNSDHDINERLYLSNMENCITHITEDAAAHVISQRQNPKKFDRFYGEYFITNEKSLKNFIKQGNKLSQNQMEIRAFLTSELDHEYKRLVPYFDKVKTKMSVKRARKEKIITNKLEELWEIGLILGGVGLLVAILLCLAANKNETFSHSRSKAKVN